MRNAAVHCGRWNHVANLPPLGSRLSIDRSELQEGVPRDILKSLPTSLRTWYTVPNAIGAVIDLNLPRIAERVACHDRGTGQ